MSLETAADEERLLVMKLLEEAEQRNAGNNGTHLGPSSSPRLRSPTWSSISGVRAPPVQRSTRSMLDILEPSKPKSGPSGIGDSKRESAHDDTPHLQPPRSSLSGTPRSASFEAAPQHLASSGSRLSEFQFSDIVTNNVGHALPKRNTQGGARHASIADPGMDLSATIMNHPTHHFHSRRPASVKEKSRSPGHRSVSPGTRLDAGLSRPSQDMLLGNSLMLDSGLHVQRGKAYAILSDENLGKVGIDVASSKRSSGATPRLQKMWQTADGELLSDSSDNDGSSSEEEGHRGRPKTRSEDHRGSAPVSGMLGLPFSPVRTSSSGVSHAPRSLLAAAEEERLEQQGLPGFDTETTDPSITVTSPLGRCRSPRGIRQTRSGSVHPNTSYDEPGSGTATPVDSTVDDIKRAQDLSFSHTAIISQPESHRTIRIVYRGEYGKVAAEAKQETRKLRKYLAACDLSDESTYALEWAVGTVLRDGDTLIAMCCIEDDGGDSSAQVPDDRKAMKEQAAAIRDVTASGRIPAQGLIPSYPPSYRPSPAVSPIRNPSTLDLSPHVQIREQLVRSLTDKICKLLRRTRLQVRVVVEVLHCKNPRNLMMEVIDLINPTLVILGSRGRSALKGVILGSFSNYLVTRSSVPVMVARKKLRNTGKPHKRPLDHVNVLKDPTLRSLADPTIHPHTNSLASATAT